MEINSEIAELCGVILGDGHLHNTENRITITGSIEDLSYYQGYLSLLFKKNFKLTPKLVKVKNKNSYRLILENKEVFKFFVNKLGLIRGKKNNISIPEIVFNNPDLLKPFIRGLFDTDGYLKFSKQNKNTNNYPRIRFSFYKTPLSLQLSDVFLKLNFNFGFGKDSRWGTLCYEISGSKNLERWMDLIGFANKVHLTKYLVWKELGHVPSRLSLFQRQELLKTQKENFIR